MNSKGIATEYRAKQHAAGLGKIAGRWVFDGTRYCIGCEAALAPRESICAGCLDEQIDLNERQEKIRRAAEAAK